MKQHPTDPSPRRRRQVRKIAEEAVECPADQRTELLDTRCGDDPSLRHEVETLLSSHKGADERGGFFSADDHPSRIGPYRILSSVGRGGMGVVYLAEQEEPIRRRVAIKLIQIGMDTREVIARFEQERQALTLMDHANIARVLDAGSTEQGRPYFSMEYVQGEPITEYCDRHRLDTRQRLELFVQVCEGVQHAHQKGVIHRDLKPSNVLVTIDGDRAVPKIIDFGIAKATDQRLTEKTVFTKMGVLMGTPEYMSPEQAELTALDIDTRTDVYSLGVMLYELLAGELPFDSKTLREGGFDEIRRRIREEEPLRPSARLSTLPGGPTDAARNRQTRPGTLIQDLRGDLDLMTMMALEKDRTRRYGSPSEFAADVLRYLNDEPVIACPPSAGYRIQKFVRRNRIAVATVGIVAATIVVGLVGTSYGLVRSLRAESTARQEAMTAERVSEFLVDLFKVSDPGEARGSAILAREVLESGADRVRTELADQPEIQVRLMDTMSEVYLNLGLLERARDLSRLALDVRLRTLSEGHVDVTASRGELAELMYLLGDVDEARDLLNSALEVGDRTVGPDSVELIDTLAQMTWLEALAGNFDLARDHLDRAEGILEKSGSEDPDLHITILQSRVALLLVLGEQEQAMPLSKKILEIEEQRWGVDSPELVQGLMNHASMLLTVDGRALPMAIELQQRAQNIQIRQLGEDHPDVAATTFRLGSMIMTGDSDRERGWELVTSAIALQEKTLGPDHPDVADSLTTFGHGRMSAKDYSSAREIFERVLQIRETALGSEHPETAETLGDLAEASRLGGDYRRGIREYGRACEIWEARLGPDHPELATHLSRLANLHGVAGDLDRALDLTRRALGIVERTFPPGHWRISQSLASVAISHTARGELAQAQDLLEQAVEQLDEANVENRSLLAGLRLDLAGVVSAAGDPEGARPLYELALDAKRDLDGEAWDVPYTEACYEVSRGNLEAGLVALRLAMDAGYPHVWLRHEPGLIPLHDDPEFQAMVRVVLARNGIDPDVAGSHAELGRIWYEKARYAEAVPHFAEAARVDQDKSWYPFMLAKCLRLSAQFDEALPHIVRAIEMDAELSHNHWERGRLEFDQGRFEQATSHYRRALDVNPQDKYAWDGLGTSLRWLQRYPEAIEAYRKGIEVDPSYSNPWSGLATAYLYAGDQELVRETINDGISASNGFANGPGGPRLLFHAGLNGEAVTMLEGILRRQAEHVDARILLSQIYLDDGRPTRAQEIVRPVLELDTNRTQLAAALTVLGDREGSLEKLGQAIGSEWRYVVAAGYALNGEHDRAFELLEQAVHEWEVEIAWVRHDPDFTSMRSDPRFVSLVR